jgi:hypothetical protein
MRERERERERKEKENKISTGVGSPVAAAAGARPILGACGRRDGASLLRPSVRPRPPPSPSMAGLVVVDADHHREVPARRSSRAAELENGDDGQTPHAARRRPSSLISPSFKSDA